MSATLDYAIKPAMKFLTKDNRWNVLTILILHANIRNRSWTSIETMSEMATNGNRTKANRAKLWLEKHKAFELVPFDKRVGTQEQDLPARLHIYQLTGVIQCCDDKTCDCGGTGEIIRYLHFNSPNGQTIQEGDSLNGGTNGYTNGVANSPNGKTVDSPDGHTINSPDGGTGSISTEVYPIEVVKTLAPNGAGSRKPQKKTFPPKEDTSPEHIAIVSLIKAWKVTSGSAKFNPYGNKTMRAEALELHNCGVTYQDIVDFIKSLQMDNYWRNKEIRWDKVTGGVIPWMKSQSNRVQRLNLPKPVEEKPALVPDPEYANVFPPEDISPAALKSRMDAILKAREKKEAS